MPEAKLPEDVGQVKVSNEGTKAGAKVRPDGRVAVQFYQKAFKLTKYLQKRGGRQDPRGQALTRNNREYDSAFQSILAQYSGIPRINIAIQIVGSRGDVQPFVAIGQVLSRPPYNHRVRLCTHPMFKDFVEENGLEFFSIGGDPAVLMAYMVKNPGLIPGRESWKAGDVGKRRHDIAEILEGCWRSCIESGNGMGGERRGPGARARASTEDADCLFIADAIIANPVSYGHIHCAEKLGIPLHMMFTMPWSPTQYFPHPLAFFAFFERNELDPHFANYMSYILMELLAWQGLSDIINGFRTKTLNLDPISPLWGHMLLSRMKVPFTYTWSSTLIPKPPDWGSYINISGFSFLSLASSYTPSKDLLEFLEAGPPPVYIGFGSIVVDKPDELTNMIFGAVKRAGVRALVLKGWGGIGEGDTPDGVYLLGNVPHDWLFQYVSCVVHHGGAGTTAIGIAMGKPTVVVPFFGDQPFWGAMIYRAGAGPKPVPYKKMTEEILAESITVALSPEIQTAVKNMSVKISDENGSTNAADIFHQMVNMDSMRCLLSPVRIAVWRVRKTKLRLSGLAAAVLLDNGCLQLSQLKLNRHRDWYVDEGASTPLVGAMAVASGTITNTVVNTGEYLKNISKSMQKKKDTESKDSEDDTTNTSPLEFSDSLDYIPSRYPVQAAANYSPQHMEALSYWMASKALPNMNDRAKKKKSKRKANSWAPARKSTSSTPRPERESHGHGRVHEVASETGHFISSMIGIGLRAPVALFYNIANGFHNAPSVILHDPTVRRRDNITGFGSGAKVGGMEFTLGLFDGLTGIVTLPYRGARKEGISGFGKGIGQGLGGLVFKTGAAVFGPIGYTLKGVEKQFDKRYSKQLKAKILNVRLRQGVAEYTRASAAEKEEILNRWKEFGSVV